ncbi:MAG: hypothetical protein HUN04_15865 [Desulfobacter sp.]|nr:MAG: hypothetical protein HUN04_15865 [Desulfobacter sp.]
MGNGYGRGTFLETSIFLSPAFLSLGNKGTSPTVSGCSVKILILILGKRQFRRSKAKKGREKMVRSDDNRFTLTYKELEARGIKQGAATRGFDELLAKGFISIVDPGGAFEKHKAVYALEDKYLMWRIGHPPIYQRQRDVHRGYQNPDRRGEPNKNATLVNDGHPHTCQQGTPL